MLDNTLGTTKNTCMVSCLVGQICGECSRLVYILPNGSTAIVVICEHFVVVRVQTSKQRASGRTAHGGSAVGVSELGTFVPK